MSLFKFKFGVCFFKFQTLCFMATLCLWYLKPLCHDSLNLCGNKVLFLDIFVNLMVILF